MLKTSLLSLALFLPLTAAAQESAAPKPAVTAGPLFTLGVSRFMGDVSPGDETLPSFAFDIGALGSLRLAEDLSALLGLIYASRGMYFQSEANPTLSDDLTTAYLMFAPAIKYGPAFLGLGVGLPMSGSHITRTSDSLAANVDLPVSNISTSVEARVGVMFSAAETETGELHFILLATYPFTNTLTGTRQGVTASGQDGPIASFQLGLTYQFGLNFLKF